MTSILNNKAGQIYLVLLDSYFLFLFPVPLISGISLLLMCAALIGVYGIKRKDSIDALTKNHAKFIIRFVWISAAISLLCALLTAAYVSVAIDNTPLKPCLDQMASNAEMITNAKAITALMAPCMDDYNAINKTPIMISSLLMIAPPTLYLLYKTIVGLRLLAKGSET